METKTCKRCLYDSTHPFGLTFNREICSGCLTYEEKFTLDWDARFERLREVVEIPGAKRRDFDCVVPIRGTPETFTY